MLPLAISASLPGCESHLHEDGVKLLLLEFDLREVRGAVGELVRLPGRAHERVEGGEEALPQALDRLVPVTVFAVRPVEAQASGNDARVHFEQVAAARARAAGRAAQVGRGRLLSGAA